MEECYLNGEWGESWENISYQLFMENITAVNMYF